MTETRPRISEETYRKKEDIKESLRILEKDGTDIDKFKGEKGEITDDRLFYHALKAMEKDGYV